MLSTSQAPTKAIATASTNMLTDSYPNIQLCDFGMSAKVPKIHFKEAKTGGSEYWQPPEQCQSPNMAGPAQDIWALGAVIHYLALGEPPCDGSKGNPNEEGAAWRASLPRKVTKICLKPAERKRMFKNITTGGLRTEFNNADCDKKWGGCYSKLLNYWMQRCLLVDVEKRATAFEIVRDLGGVYREVTDKCKGNSAGFAKRVRNMTM
jgi:serine/threonine protein kinase